MTQGILGADDPTARAPGKGFHMKFDFRETITFPVTLYKARPVPRRRRQRLPRAPAFVRLTSLRTHLWGLGQPA
jgi:hypothetical protein